MSRASYLWQIPETTEYKFSILTEHFYELSAGGVKMKENLKDLKELQ